MTTKLAMEILEFGVEEICVSNEETVTAGAEFGDEPTSVSPTRADVGDDESEDDSKPLQSVTKMSASAPRRSTRASARAASLSSQSGADDDSSTSAPAQRTRASSSTGSGTGAPCTRSSRGRADSGALLDMLAEVASQKLLFSPMKPNDRAGTDGVLLSAAQIKNSSTNQLIKMFSSTEFDEMRRWYKYKCTIDDCNSEFGSFGSEGRAKDRFKQHLLQHLENLKASEALSLGSGGRSTAVKRKSEGGSNNFSGYGIKRKRKPRGVRELMRDDDLSESQIKTDVDEDEDDDENDDNDEMLSKVEDWDDSEFILPELENKPAGFLFEEKGPKVEVEVVGYDGANSNEEHPRENRESSHLVDLQEEAENSAAVNLNRLIAGLSEKMGVAGEHSYSNNNNNDTVMIYVVEGDSLVLKAVPSTNQQSESSNRTSGSTSVSASGTKGGKDVKEDDSNLSDVDEGGGEEGGGAEDDAIAQREYPVIRSAELPIIANNQTDTEVPPAALQDPSALWELNNGENIERDEFQHARKPKGKAKFIGQSRHEKELAMAAIDAIRTKTGSGVDSLQCNICQPPRTFTAPTTLISHYRSHAGIKPYECRVCSSSFTRQHSLNYHMLIHTNQTRFTCLDCGRKFRHPSHFREHRRRHTGESPFECSDCLMRFKTRNTYKRHLRTRHGKVLTTSGGLIILSDDQFQMVRTGARGAGDRGGTNTYNSRTRGRPRKVTPGDNGNTQYTSKELDSIDEDMKALHQLEIVTANESFEENYEVKDEPLDISEMQTLMTDEEVESYEDIVKEAVGLEHENITQKETGEVIHEEDELEETFVVDTDDPLSVTGLYLATLEDGETVLVDTRGAVSDDGAINGGAGSGGASHQLLQLHTSSHQPVDLGFKVLGMSKVAVAAAAAAARNRGGAGGAGGTAVTASGSEPTVIVIKNDAGF